MGRENGSSNCANNLGEFDGLESLNFYLFTIRLISVYNLHNINNKRLNNNNDQRSMIMVIYLLISDPYSQLNETVNKRQGKTVKR